MSRKFMGLLSLAVLLYLAPLTQAGLIGWWTLDEGTGTTVGDSSGNGLTGTFRGNPQWLAEGEAVFGSALRFADGPAAGLALRDGERQLARIGDRFAVHRDDDVVGADPRVPGGALARDFGHCDALADGAAVGQQGGAYVAECGA
mgnify:CR=1 FL=1